MIIYPLPPEELDDKTLSQQIKEIAQTLCNVHHCYAINFEISATIPLKRIETRKRTINSYKFVDWARTCAANYDQLVKMGLACCGEYNYRFEEIKYDELTRNISHIKINEHKLRHIIEWTRDNMPDLPVRINSKYKIEDGCINLETRVDKEVTTPFPLVMPDEFIENAKITDPERWGHVSNVVYAYRRYYCSVLPKDAKWTRREKPEWWN